MAIWHAHLWSDESVSSPGARWMGGIAGSRNREKRTPRGSPLGAALDYGPALARSQFGRPWPLAVIRRAAVLFDTPHASAAARAVRPGTAIVAGAFRGLPSRLPCALARCRPNQRWVGRHQCTKTL